MLYGNEGYVLALFFLAVAWTTVWKGLALWRAGRSNHLAWFVVIMLFNTLGLLEIIYLAFFQRTPWVGKAQPKSVAAPARKPARKTKRK